MSSKVRFLVTSVFVVALLGTTAVAQPGSASPPASGDPAQLKAVCGAAMNADPRFAEAVIRVAVEKSLAGGPDAMDPEHADAVLRLAERKLADQLNREQITKDLCTIKTHADAQASVAKNERHVIMAYAAMWVVAAGFLVFLWLRQLGLKSEIANLRRDLADAKEAT